MPFRNPLAAGAELIKDALQSAGFVTGVSGWQIRRDGAAEFNSLAARGDISIGVGNTTLSVKDQLARLAASRTYLASYSAVGVTSVAALPGAQIIGPAELLQGVNPFLFGGSAFPDSTAVQLNFTITLVASSTSTTGSGGHLQVRYVYADGHTDDYFLSNRNGSNNGDFTVTMSWSDLATIGQIKRWKSFTSGVGGSDLGPYLAARHTGSTAYTINQIVWVLTTKYV